MCGRGIVHCLQEFMCDRRTCDDHQQTPILPVWIKIFFKIPLLRGFKAMRRRGSSVTLFTFNIRTNKKVTENCILVTSF
mgnify:CR=1 FL=1